jgi:hypothetical protein
VKDAREYEEGFGPSVNVRVGADDTIWKRSRFASHPIPEYANVYRNFSWDNVFPSFPAFHVYSPPICSLIPDCSNKWNPFEKIKTLDDADSETAFTVMWDRNHSNSFYVTERMYYYLDREKHKDKYKTIRAKLYITRLHQKGMLHYIDVTRLRKTHKFFPPP